MVLYEVFSGFLLCFLHGGQTVNKLTLVAELVERKLRLNIGEAAENNEMGQ